MQRVPVGLIACFAVSGMAGAEGLDADAAGRFAQLALDCVHKQYPNKIAHVMRSDEDAKPPRELTPAFYGCFDWHSSVHGHWLLARVARMFPNSDVAKQARAALAFSLTPQNIATEVAYITTPGRESFERPYGIAWLLQLAAELRASDDPRFGEWATTIAPLEGAAVVKLTNWLPKLNYPIRRCCKGSRRSCRRMTRDEVRCVRRPRCIRERRLPSMQPQISEWAIETQSPKAVPQQKLGQLFRASRASRCLRTSRHSATRMLYITESRAVPSRRGQ